MKTSYYKNLRFSQRAKMLITFCLFSLLFSLFFPLAACKEKTDYLAYVSEKRANLFLADVDGFSLRVYALEKEYPYSLDGVKRDTSVRTEFYLSPPSGDKTCNLSFVVDGKTYGGEMSYDNVRAEYYYSCTVNVEEQTAIDCTVVYDKQEIPLRANSVKTENTLSAQKALEMLVLAENDFFATLTDKYGFAGELQIRLLYEDFPYYYVGVVDRNGNVTAFLLNGETGKVLAKRQTN